MKIPREIPVMTLPKATLFPQALLPLYVFEPRYRQMLADALHSNRMFSVAMQKAGSPRGTPSPVAGVGVGARGWPPSADFAGHRARGTGESRPLQAVSDSADPPAGDPAVRQRQG